MSSESDQYERDVAAYIDKINNVDAERPSVGTGYSDVRITYKKKKAWLEVKMNHTDNLGNPRVFYESGKWQTNYDTPIAKEACKKLNSSEEAKNFVRELAGYCNISLNDIVIPTTKTGLKNKNAVSIKSMKNFCKGRPNAQYIMKLENVNVSKLVEKHYSLGKQEPAYYIQTGDDLYRLTDKDPFGFNFLPRLSGQGSFKVRVGIRSDFYEVQLEMKLTKISSSSSYSLKPGTKKKHPFNKR